MNVLTLTIALHRSADIFAQRPRRSLVDWVDSVGATPPDDFREFSADVNRLEDAIVGFMIAARYSTLEHPEFTANRGAP